MYLRAAANHLLLHKKELDIMSRRVSEKYNVSRAKVVVDAILSCAFHGTIFTEYEALDFYRRSTSNRRTYVTVFWLVRQLSKYNTKEEGRIFHNKKEFNKRFKDFTKRETLDLTEASEQETEAFMGRNKKAVLKGSEGCSGKQVKVADTSGMTAREFLTYAKKNGYDMAETYIENHAVIKALNPTSLNTMRIVTIHSDEIFEVMVAGLRIGAVGSDVDNVSMGGTIARIDPGKGELDTVFLANSYREIPGSQSGRDETGLKIPYFKETIEMLKEASKVLKNMHIIGWDVAVTPEGPVIIEGNESFHTVTMQLYNDYTQPGLKPRFKEVLARLEEELKEDAEQQD